MATSLRIPKAGRVATAILSGTATVLYGVVVSYRAAAAAEQAALRHHHHHHHRYNHEAKIEWAWDVLPLIPLGASFLWSLFSLLTLSTGDHFYLPRRLHLAIEALISISLVIMGYLSLVYNIIVKNGGGLSGSSKEWAMRDAGVALLSVVFVTHAVFFRYGCSQSSPVQNEKKVEEGLPQYSQSEGSVFGDGQSVRSLPVYEAGTFEVVDLEKEKDASVTVVEIDNSVV